jgi:hypothetical protein
MFSTLEDIDCADDFALLSTKQDHMQEKTNRHSWFASQLGLQIDTRKTELMRFNNTSQSKLKSEGNEIMEVDFLTLEPILCTEDSTQTDIKNRLAKARVAFHKLRNIWKSKQFKRKTKIRLYNSNVKSIFYSMEASAGELPKTP